MKPMIILPVGAMSDDNIKRLRDNEICVVIAKEPALVKFVDPIPCQSSRSEIEMAALALSRKMLSPGYWRDESVRREVSATYLDILLKGTSLDGKSAQIEEQAYMGAKLDELRKLARDDARAEREAKKKADAEAKK